LFHGPDSVIETGLEQWFRLSPVKGGGAFRGIKGGSAPLARSYRGPDNVAGPISGHLNPALAVVSVMAEKAPPGNGRGA